MVESYERRLIVRNTSNFGRHLGRRVVDEVSRN